MPVAITSKRVTQIFIMKKQIQDFFNRPGINKSGICIEAGITQQYLNRILRGTQPITDSFLSKIIPVLESYGFEAGGKEIVSHL